METPEVAESTEVLALIDQLNQLEKEEVATIYAGDYAGALDIRSEIYKVSANLLRNPDTPDPVKTLLRQVVIGNTDQLLPELDTLKLRYPAGEPQVASSDPELNIGQVKSPESRPYRDRDGIVARVKILGVTNDISTKLADSKPEKVSALVDRLISLVADGVANDNVTKPGAQAYIQNAIRIIEEYQRMVEGEGADTKLPGMSEKLRQASVRIAGE